MGQDGDPEVRPAVRLERGWTEAAVRCRSEVLRRWGERPEVVVETSEDQRYAELLGERLRRVRQQQGLSLHDVEARSDGELKASVVGAYERGERAVSITRLHRMASFFRVPVAELLPDRTIEAPRMGGEPPELVLDLVALEQHGEVEPALARYAEAIQARRGDYNGRVLTVRSADLDMLAAILNAQPDELRSRLSSEGIVR